ncbi:913_t:CDS:2, partial [Acaulospora morrowiae]
IHAASAAIQNLKIRKEENRQFFTETNLVLLSKLKKVMIKIAKYIKEIREFKWLRRYFTSKSIEETFRLLTTEFDGYISSLNFSIIIELKMQNEKDCAALKHDTHETNQLLLQLVESVNYNKEFRDDVTKIKDGVMDIKECVQDIKNIKDCVHDIVTMLKHFEEFSTMKKLFNNLQSSQYKSELKEEDFIDSLLNLGDFTFAERSRGGIQKWIRNSDHLELAFTEINSNLLSKEHQKSLLFEVSLLKKLRGSRDIVQFYGLVKDEYRSKMYLVTEWSQYGNLREYYKQKKLKPSIKLQIALDIALGLNFLQACQILHRDLRSVNIMIGSHEHAKLANF